MESEFLFCGKFVCVVIDFYLPYIQKFYTYFFVYTNITMINIYTKAAATSFDDF